jgi:hypothetical protein
VCGGGQNGNVIGGNGGYVKATFAVSWRYHTYSVGMRQISERTDFGLDQSVLLGKGGDVLISSDGGTNPKCLSERGVIAEVLVLYSNSSVKSAGGWRVYSWT